jgi:hypothetical protein
VLKPFWKKCGRSLSDWRSHDERLEEEEREIEQLREQARREVEQEFSVGRDSGDENNEKNQV